MSGQNMLSLMSAIRTTRGTPMLAYPLSIHDVQVLLYRLLSAVHNVHTLVQTESLRVQFATLQVVD